jgi:RHS repeat-associated protein
LTDFNSAQADSTTYAFDAAGNQTLMVQGYGGSDPATTISKYDGDNNLTRQVDADGNTSDYAFDAVGEQTQAIVGAGSSDAGTTADLYDGDGNLTLSVNAVGDSSSYQYDADGNQTLVVQGYGACSAATVHYLYDDSGNQIEEVDPDGNTTSYEYNADGEQTLMVQAYGSSVAATTGYEYDEDGNVTLQTNPNGTSIASNYDDQGNLTSQTWYAAGGGVTNSLAYTYDEDGNILTASNDAGSYSFAYNADGEQTLVVAPSGVTLNYEYDADGNTTQVSDSLGDTITSQYDADGNLTSRGYSGPNSAQLLLTFEYDGDGNLMSVNRYSDLAGTQLVGTSIYAYNPQGLVSSIQHSAGGTTLATFAYNYDAAGELSQEVDNGTTTAYAYDATGQLTSAGPTNYAYDANGNPNQSTDTIGPNNELLSDGTWNYSYDTNGNQTGKTGVSGGTDAGLTWSYTYDASNELIGATETNSQNQTLVQANYVYDVFNHLIESSVSTNGGTPVVSQYVYNGNTLWATLNGSGALQDAYIAGDQPDQFYAQYDASNGVAWYLTDHLGSVRDTMTNAGTLPDTITYDAYGNITAQSNAAQAPNIGFAGYQTFAALGLDKAGGRWYNPQTQQWMQEDSILLQAGPNPREYVNDGPTNATDPTGQDPLFPGLERWGDQNVINPLGRLFNRTSRVTNRMAGAAVAMHAPAIAVTRAAIEKSAEWWTQGTYLFDQAEANKLRDKKALRAVAPTPAPNNLDLKDEDRKDLYVLNVEDQKLLLRELGGKYYVVLQGYQGRSAETTDDALVSNYRHLEGQKWLPLVDGSLRLALHLLPFGQTALLLSEGKTDEALEAAAWDALAYGTGGLGILAKAAKARGLAKASRSLTLAAKGGAAVLATADAVGAVHSINQIRTAIASGHWTVAEVAGYGAQAVLQLLSLHANLKTALKCFAAGTPVQTPQGARPIERIQDGDWVLASPEDDPSGEVRPRLVEAAFVRYAPLLRLGVGGRVIRVTAEHPIYARGLGWVNAGELRVGDEVRSHEGVWRSVEFVEDRGEEGEVYNLRIAEDHTYFVGGDDWGFSVWVHNANPRYLSKAEEAVLKKVQSGEKLNDTDKEVLGKYLERVKANGGKEPSKSHRDRSRKGKYLEAKYAEQKTVQMTDAEKRELKPLFQRREAARARGDVNAQKLATEALGEKGAELYARDHLNLKSEPVYKAPAGEAASQRTFDRVYEEGGKVYVVEAKGGGARLGTAEYNGQPVQQGTREYLERTLELMGNSSDPKTRAAAEKILQALDAKPPRLEYLKVQVPVARTGKPDQLKNFSVGKFDISGSP